MSIPAPFQGNARRIAYSLFLLSGASGPDLRDALVVSGDPGSGEQLRGRDGRAFGVHGGPRVRQHPRAPASGVDPDDLRRAGADDPGHRRCAALVLLPRSWASFVRRSFGALAGHHALLNLSRFLLAFLVLAVPSSAMGMTLPALAQALGAERGSFRAVLGRLYGLNTLGAIAGVLASEMLAPAQRGGVRGGRLCRRAQRRRGGRAPGNSRGTGRSLRRRRPPAW
jgi:hypothetical protein